MARRSWRGSGVRCTESHSAVTELSVVTAMLQFSLTFGPQKVVDGIPRKRMRIPKLKHFELIAKIYQAQGLVPSDDNGLADPYVRIGLAGANRETHTIHASRLDESGKGRVGDI